MVRSWLWAVFGGVLFLAGVVLAAEDPLSKALLQAAEQGNLAEVKRLVALGADPNYKNVELDFPLAAAAAGGYFEVVQYLLEQGADPDPFGKLGGHALIAAAYGGHERVVRLLVLSGADVNGFTCFGITPLYAAVWRDPLSLAIARYLLLHGADPNPVDEMGETPLTTAVARGEEAMARLLLAYGADPNLNLLDEPYPRGALHLAVDEGNLVLVQRLLKHGANPWLRDGDGKTAFDYARGRPELLKLLTCGQDPLAESCGWQVLHP